MRWDAGWNPTMRPRSARSCASAGEQDYRFSALVLGIVNSTPFQMRRTPMIITRKALPRRTFLRGMGATLVAAAAGRDVSGA